MAGKAEKPPREDQIQRALEARQAHDPVRITSDEYLERYSVAAYMKDLLTVLLENRPEEPLDFIADYFNCAVNGVPPIMRSYRYIRLTKRNRQAFMDNLAQAYTIMSRSSEVPGSGLTGANYLRLLNIVCADFPAEVVHALLQVLDKKDTDTISFPTFVAGINACLLYEEFFEHAERLFNACEVDNAGRVEKETFLATIKQINALPQDVQHPTEGWTVPGNLLMERVTSALAASQSDRVDSKTMITFREFLSTIIKVFVACGEVM